MPDTQQQLSNEEIARVFAMYLHQQVEFDGRIGNIVSYYLSCGDLSKQVWCVSLEDEEFNKNELSCSVTIYDIKLLLVPLNKLTDEDALAASKIMGGANHLSDKSQISQLKEIVCSNKLYNMQTNVSGANWFYLFQHLTLKGYAVPLFFDIYHWANGMTAIELNLAIDKTLQQ